MPIQFLPTPAPANKLASYNQHPDHVAFVKTFWIRDVDEYLEIDYESIK